MRTAVLLLLLLIPGLCLAASPDDAFIAARDQAIAALKKAGSGDTTAEQTRLAAPLEKQLRALIGPMVLPGFSGPSALNPDTLSSEDEGFGGLDGIRFSDKAQTNNVVVTTEGLLRRWLVAHKSWWKDLANPPSDVEAAFHAEPFYTQGVSTDAAVSIFAPLPIRKPAGAAIAVALLVEESQNLATDPPTQIAVSLVKGGRAFIAIVDATTKPGPIAACDAVWKSFKARSAAAEARYDASGLKDQKSFDEAIKLENDGADALHKCWAQKASGERTFAALTQQAQGLADLFAAR